MTSVIEKTDGPQIVEALFDKYAEEYHQKFNKNILAVYQRQRVHREMAPYLQNASRLLDVGCGPGSDFEFYQKFDFQVDAIDSSPNMVQLAAETAKRLGLSLNIQCVPLDMFSGSEAYDVILLNFGVLNAVEKIDMALNKLRKLLLPAGVLVAVIMPPLHIGWLAGSFLRFRWRTMFRRLFRREVKYANGFKVRFYSGRHFRRYFTVRRKVHLGAFLPTPDQCRKNRLANKIAQILMPLDRALAARVPDFIGGDHVCYILQRSRESLK